MSDWELRHELSLACHQDLRQKIQDRSRAVPSSHTYQSLTREIGASLGSFISHVQGLERDLNRGSAVTPREISRRQKLVEDLHLKHRQIKAQIDDIAQPRVQQRFQLLQAPLRSGAGLADMGSVAWAHDDGDEDDTGLSSPEQVMACQDEGLDALHEVIVRQNTWSKHRHGGGAQNHLLEDIDTGMDQTRQRLLDTTRQITHVERRDRTCRYWAVILALLVPIVILFLLPDRK
ncbi:LOW QUALITY PROTEIN: uncharacterized protein LOC131889488 [Tigriopus californicus]|uniref:LOW QUALITY PROTEIN: uncharacterized protein LOC131889488 n=1 Tax=Tigriopus californicus TaxID=6832 RepID=UPI0027DAB06C|nr:LOW QUALITY PROTEIN: uncharacterized protein LOC131889488 [Tigriopus californicus]